MRRASTRLISYDLGTLFTPIFFTFISFNDGIILKVDLQVALEKLKLEQVNSKHYESRYFKIIQKNTTFICKRQDVTGETENDTKKKKDVARLLKTALGVELKEKLIGDFPNQISILPPTNIN